MYETISFFNVCSNIWYNFDISLFDVLLGGYLELEHFEMLSSHHNIDGDEMGTNPSYHHLYGFSP